MKTNSKKKLILTIKFDKKLWKLLFFKEINQKIKFNKILINYNLKN
jgi:hypothetical protein